MLYINHQFLSNADNNDNDAFHNAGDSISAASSCFALLNAFASQITKPELQANERMRVWETLLETLKDSHKF
jgi:hypothetical protein